MTRYLKDGDYITILKYYDIDTINSNRTTRKKIARNIIAEKLCRCIKKLNKTKGSDAISICKNSVLTKKNLTALKFTCKDKQKLLRLKTFKK
jgi:hypothetical protein